MKSKVRSRRGLTLGVGALAVALGLLAAGCSSSNTSKGSSSSANSSSGDAKLAALVPEAIKKRGYVVGAIDITFPPFALQDPGGKNLEGIDIEVSKALSGLLGVEVRPTPVPFANFIPALKSGRADLGMTDVADTTERRADADFVDFLKVGATTVSPEASSLAISTTADLCGHTVAIQSGTSAVAATQKQQAECPSSSPMKLSQYDSQNDAVLALLSGRADVMVGTAPSNAYLVSHSGGKLKVNSPVLNPPSQACAGFAFPKGSTLLPAVLGAMQELYDSGDLKKIYDKYGLGDILAAPGKNVSIQNNVS